MDNQNSDDPECDVCFHLCVIESYRLHGGYRNSHENNNDYCLDDLRDNAGVPLDKE